MSLSVYLHDNYRYVRPDEPLKTGDLLVFKGLSKDGRSATIEHLATYIAGDLVFTKNGLNQFNPYILQELKSNVFHYFKDKPYQLIAFRIPEPGLKVASETERVSNKPIYYFQSSRMVYLDIGYNPDEPLEERIKSLDNLKKDWLRNSQLATLAELREDPSAKDVKDLVQILIAKHNKTPKDVRLALSFIDYKPFGSLEENSNALKALLNEESLVPINRLAIEWIVQHHRAQYQNILEELARKFNIVLPRLGPREHCEQFFGPTEPIRNSFKI